MHAYLVTELKQNDELEQGMLKAIISSEMMSVEHKFQDPREIEPFAKHIIRTNHMPRIKDYSDGLFRRISIIKLIRKFDRDAKDPNRPKKLMQLSRAHWMPRVQMQPRHRGVKLIQIIGKPKQTTLPDRHHIICDIGMEKALVIDRHHGVGNGNNLPFHPCRTGGKSCIQSWSSPIAARPMFMQF